MRAVSTNNSRRALIHRILLPPRPPRIEQSLSHNDHAVYRAGRVLKRRFFGGVTDEWPDGKYGVCFVEVSNTLCMPAHRHRFFSLIACTFRGTTC
jgi:hypothetical protein